MPNSTRFWSRADEEFLEGDLKWIHREDFSYGYRDGEMAVYIDWRRVYPEDVGREADDRLEYEIDPHREINDPRR